MLGRLLLLFLLTPAVELGLLIQVDRLIGFGPTIGLIIATGLVGSYLARREGLTTWRRLNNRLRRGELPGKELGDGVIILVAGALLITPGVLTDLIGFLGLFPLTRAPIRRLLMRRLQSKVEQGSMNVQFGMFGASPPSPGGPAAPDEMDPSSEREDAASWKGKGRQVPNHTDASDSPDADSSDSS